MKNVILLIGGELCRRVVMNLDRTRWQAWGLRRHPTPDPGMRWIRADVGKPESLRGVPPDISHVLYAPSPDARERPSYRTAYPLGVEHVLDAVQNAPRLQRFVLVGSTVVWPAADAARAAAWVDERTPARAANFRAEAILQAEAKLHERLPGRGVALRLGGLYGPRRTRLIDRLRSGRLVSPDGPGHWSNRIHIDDAATACVHLLGLPRPQDCYIGTDGNPTPTRAFYDALADLLEAPRPAARLRPPSGKRLCNARLVDSGWTPRWSDALAAYRALLADLPPPSSDRPGQP